MLATAVPPARPIAPAFVKLRLCTTRGAPLSSGLPSAEMPQGAEELLEFYKHRVDAFDAERQDLLARLEACNGATPAQIYKLQAENRKRTEEVRELQKALSDAHTYLFEERERLLALQADNDVLRLQEVEDRARIKQLLSITRPVEHKVVYGGENGPHSNAIFPRSGGNRSPRRSCGSASSAANTNGSSAGGASSCGSGSGSIPPASGPPPERILRTVYLPTAQTEALSLKCEALQAQLAEQKRFAAERIAALQEDRRIREQDAAAHAAALSATAEELAQKLQAAEAALRRTTRDYIMARQQWDVAEQAAAEAKEAATAAEQRERRTLEQQQQRAAAELEQLRQELEADSSATHQALQEQLAQREEELLKFETLHRLIRGQLEARAVEAERRAARLAAHNRELQQRRAHEMEGWAADVGQLRKRIAAVDRRLKQMALLQRLPDDERRDALLAKHARMAPAEYEYECSLDELVEEMMGIKDSLLGMGQQAWRQQQQQAQRSPSPEGSSAQE